MNILNSALILASLVTAQTHATGQPKQEIKGQSAPVVVVGRTVTREKAVRRLVNRMTSMTSGQVARFSTSLCFGVDGFIPPHDETVRRRMEEDAKAANLRVRDGCKPNVMVILVDNGREVLRTLYREKPALFLDLNSNDRRNLLEEPGPVHVMTITDLRSSEGRLPTKTPPPGVVIAGASYYLPVQTASIINVPMRQDIISSMILIDKSATLGKSLRQIADYAAMRTLARLRGADVVTSEPTILGLFTRDGANPPKGLTTFDQHYLRGLYAGDANREGYAKAADIARKINAGIRKEVDVPRGVSSNADRAKKHAGD